MTPFSHPEDDTSPGMTFSHLAPASVTGSHDGAPVNHHTVHCIHLYGQQSPLSTSARQMAIRAMRLQTRVPGLLRGGAAAISLAAAPLQAQTVTVSPIASISIPTKFSLR